VPAKEEVRDPPVLRGSDQMELPQSDLHALFLGTEIEKPSRWRA
jgi:hypothetical protein